MTRIKLQQSKKENNSPKEKKDYSKKSQLIFQEENLLQEKNFVPGLRVKGAFFFSIKQVYCRVRKNLNTWNSNYQNYFYLDFKQSLSFNLLSINIVF